MDRTQRGDAIAGLIIATVLMAIVNCGVISADPLSSGLEQESDKGTVVQGLGQEQVVQQEEVKTAYELTAEERDLIERVVMGESGGEEYIGQQAVAQCILNACEITGNRPAAIIEGLRYTEYRPEASQSVKDAVSAVFDDGEKVIKETVMYFYAPELVYSEWHETQQYVCTIGYHKFFERSE